MTETYAGTKPHRPLFVSRRQFVAAPGWRGHKEEATYVILTATPWPQTLRPDSYSNETDGDRDREISNGLLHAVLCAHREIGTRILGRSPPPPL